MKKAFDQNVSRARPRLKLGPAASEETPALEAPEEIAASVEAPEAPADLGQEVKARAERSKAPRPTAAEAVQRALEEGHRASTSSARAEMPVEDERVERNRAVAQGRQNEAESVEAPRAVLRAPVARAEPPDTVIEVQTPAAPLPSQELHPEERRERLKERLRAVRENPRPEPLPPTVAEAGVLAVERIATLQVELQNLKALNLALTQDLEAARRQAERATEEARLRMDEARRLSAEMEGRAKLLSELERELEALEGERDEALLALQETRASLEVGEKERDGLRAEIAQRDRALSESLSEEERLAGELEDAHRDAEALRKAVEALKSERDTLARQVSDLTVERAELLEARKALQAVHRALSQAVAR